MLIYCIPYSILESRCATAADSIHTEVTDILKTEIVYPLRRFEFTDYLFKKVASELVFLVAILTIIVWI